MSSPRRHGGHGEDAETHFSLCIFHFALCIEPAGARAKCKMKSAECKTTPSSPCPPCLRGEPACSRAKKSPTAKNARNAFVGRQYKRVVWGGVAMGVAPRGSDRIGGGAMRSGCGAGSFPSTHTQGPPEPWPRDSSTVPRPFYVRTDSLYGWELLCPANLIHKSGILTRFDAKECAAAFWPWVGFAGKFTVGRILRERRVRQSQRCGTNLRFQWWWGLTMPSATSRR